MCRLFALTARLPREDSVAIVNQAMLLQMAEDQKHGWGISDGLGIWKGAGPYGHKLDWMSYIDTTKVILGHVRYASKHTRLTDEEAHPFRFDKLVAMHNGQFDAHNLMPQYKWQTPVSDSYWAFSRLMSVAQKTGDADYNEPTLSRWLSGFYENSSFAVMLLKNNVLRVFREPSRKLYYCTIKNGYLIMTSRTALAAVREFARRKSYLRNDVGKIRAVPISTLFTVPGAGLEYTQKCMTYSLLEMPWTVRVKRYFGIH